MSILIPKEVARAIHAEAERTLTPEEFRAWADGPIGEDERRETAALIEWFLRRYPTPDARLAYARRKYREWARSIPERD